MSECTECVVSCSFRGYLLLDASKGWEAEFEAEGPDPWDDDSADAAKHAKTPAAKRRKVQQHVEIEDSEHEAESSEVKKEEEEKVNPPSIQSNMPGDHKSDISESTSDCDHGR